MWPGHRSEVLVVTAQGDLEWTEGQEASHSGLFHFLLFGPCEAGRRLREQGLDSVSLLLNSGMNTGWYL